MDFRTVTPMKIKQTRPIAFFDIESTGLNRKTDRIIDLAVVTINPDGTRKESTWRLNPEIPISPEATAVHGISDDDVKDCPVFKDVAAEIEQAFAGCDLGGFNILGFDIPMLEAEFKRAGMVFDMEGRNVLDAQRIFHRKEPRDLSAALMFYCDSRHDGAHGALADVDATIRVFDAQCERYDDLPETAEELSLFCNPPDPNRIDKEGKVIWNSRGEAVVSFGQKQGQSLRALAMDDPGYLQWILRKDFPDDTKAIVRQALAGNFPQKSEA